MADEIKQVQAYLDEEQIEDGGTIQECLDQLNAHLRMRGLLGALVVIDGKIRPLYDNQDLADMPEDAVDSAVKEDEYGQYCQVLGRTFVCGAIDVQSWNADIPTIGLSLMYPTEWTTIDAMRYGGDVFMRVDEDNMQRYAFNTETSDAVEQWIRYNYSEVHDKLSTTIPNNAAHLPAVVAGLKSFSVYQNDPELLDVRLGFAISQRLQFDSEPYTITVDGMVGSVDENGERIETPFHGDIQQASFERIIMEQNGEDNFDYRPTLIFSVPTNQYDDGLHEIRSVTAESLVSMTSHRPLSSEFGKRALATFSHPGEVQQYFTERENQRITTVADDTTATLMGEVRAVVDGARHGEIIRCQDVTDDAMEMYTKFQTF